MPAPNDPAFQDPLTGLSNRRHFEVLYELAFHVADRGVPVTLALIEPDDIDACRSAEGDEGVERAIQAFGETLGKGTRTSDVAAHVDDGRFLLMLMDCNLHGGLVCAERIRDHLQEVSRSTGLTLSVGVATYIKGMEKPSELVELAERTLAAAQAAGGNRISVPADLEVE